MPIITVDNPLHERILHKPCKKVKDFNSTEIFILIQEMRKIASNPGAAGVAAPQLGKSLRGFALSTNKNYPPVFLFNPVLRGFSEEMHEVMEGCLSVPDKTMRLQRYKQIKISWQDEKGNTHNKNGMKYEFTFDGFEAQAIQHEMDHLDGVLCSDRADEVFDSSQFQKAFEEAVQQESEAQIATPDLEEIANG